ncbi:unnamed protein product, partial [marine sediment metagenome]
AAPYPQMKSHGVEVHYKPLLWFVKNKRRNKRKYIADVITHDAPEKDAHEWQQPESEAEYFIQRLTKAGELVIDPFCGGGTTAAVAHRMERDFWTSDIDPVALQSGVDRV